MLALEAVIVHVPTPVKLAVIEELPVPEHAPEAVTVGANPEVEEAETANDPPNLAFEGPALGENVKV